MRLMIMQSNKYSVNAMVKSDLTSIRIIEKESFGHPWSDRSFLRRIDNHKGYTLRADNSIGGYILVDIKSDLLTIEKMAVAPNYRGKGAGQFMICWAQELAKKCGCSYLSLHVRENNPNAIGLYKKMGFKTTA